MKMNTLSKLLITDKQTSIHCSNPIIRRLGAAFRSNFVLIIRDGSSE